MLSSIVEISQTEKLRMQIIGETNLFYDFCINVMFYVTCFLGESRIFGRQ